MFKFKMAQNSLSAMPRL